jgi:hypothetical protein
MITLFSVPKPLEGEFRWIQENAVASWCALGPEVEILLLGEEAGVGDLAAGTSARHLPELTRNECGTPRVDDIFRRAEQAARQPLLGYINADIILGSDFLAAVRIAAGLRGRFLVVGQRWNLKIDSAIDFSDAAWEGKLRNRVRAEGRLEDPSGIDYFLYRRGLWPDIPPFALGRTMWDNWLILSARRRRAMVIDATENIWAVHQIHGYAHHPQGAAGVWEGPEAQENERLAGGSFRLFTIRDATHRLAGGRIDRFRDEAHRRRERFMRPALSAPAAWAERIGNIATRLGNSLLARISPRRGETPPEKKS